MNLYNYLDKEDDPIYQLLLQINVNQSVTISDFDILLNDYGIYEIVNDDIHECKNTMEGCYHFLCLNADRVQESK